MSQTTLRQLCLQDFNDLRFACDLHFTVCCLSFLLALCGVHSSKSGTLRGFRTDSTSLVRRTATISALPVTSTLSALTAVQELSVVTFSLQVRNAIFTALFWMLLLLLAIHLH